MKYFIITGASKGLGEGIALELVNEEHHLLCISRSESDQLKKIAVAKNCSIDFFLFDLAFSHDIPDLMQRVFDKIDMEKVSGVYLINNAGLIQPVSRVEGLDADALDVHMRVNLLAPMLISSAFIGLSQRMQVQKRILNISSGAAQNPYYGWSCYCTGKAGLEMFGLCISEEQKNEEYPVETMSVAPGIIDTGMQTTIRGTDERDFIHKKKFIELKESGQLVPPALAGKKLARLLLSDDFKDGEITDIRESY
ncbi:MAG: (S)-benzoin forming benzil reductase [Bacteroidia bacterium]|nr:MAG: (S)-benzoin forming benzil reductase [Bacteroidia bacterium]